MNVIGCIKKVKKALQNFRCATEDMNRKNQVKRTKIKQDDAPASERLSLTEKTINLGKDADIRLGKPDKVDIFIDQKTKIIRLVPSDIGKRIVRAKDGQTSIASKLSKMMPCGIYLMNKNKDFVYISEYGVSCSTH